MSNKKLIILHLFIFLLLLYYRRAKSSKIQKGEGREMFKGGPVLVPSSPGKGLLVFCILILLGAVLLGLTLGNSELLSGEKRVETQQKVSEEKETTKIEISLEWLLILLLASFILGIVVALVMTRPSWPLMY